MGPTSMTQRIQVAEGHRVSPSANGTAWFEIYDTLDGARICRHPFPLSPLQAARDQLAWIEANRQVALALAAAMNGAPPGAVENIRRSLRQARRAGLPLGRPNPEPGERMVAAA